MTVAALPQSFVKSAAAGSHHESSIGLRNPRRRSAIPCDSPILSGELRRGRDMVTTREDRLHNLELAISRAGGSVAFCKSLKMSMAALGGWRNRGYVPPARALAVERMYGIPRELIVSPEVAELYLTPRPEALDLL